MRLTDFRQLREQAFQLYSEGDYAQALAVLDANAGDFPAQAVYTYNWRACMAALAGQPKRAIGLLQEGLEAGCWWSDELLRQDPDLASLLGHPDFERLATLNAEKQAKAQAAAKPELLIFEPEGGKAGPYPLLLALHGRSSSAMQTAPFWQTAAAHGWLTAVAQSSLSLGTDLFGWDDTERAREEVTAHYARLKERYPIDPDRVVLSGFSQGGGQAILLAASEAIPARGFIGVTPFLREPECLDAAISAHRRLSRSLALSGRIVLGDKDNTYATTQQILTTLRSLGIQVEVEMHTGLGHEYPSGFEERLAEMLASITNE